MPRLALLLLLLPACRTRVEDLPTEAAVAAADAAPPPALYQALYDSALLPEVQIVEQRTRILVFLRYLDLDDAQLAVLGRLAERADLHRERIREAQGAIVARLEPTLLPAYTAVWDHLRAGGELDDPALGAIAAPLLDARIAGAREAEVLAVRLQAVQTLLDEEQEFLRTLTERQEILFPDVVFCLRQDLDMAATPGDFRALVGTLFSVGDPTLVLRGDRKPGRRPLDIAGLWTDEATQDLQAPVLHEARRELLLYLLLQEEALPEAVAAAREAVAARVATAP